MGLAVELERKGLGVRVTWMGTCCFADDIVLLGESEGELESMLSVVSDMG